VCLLVACIPILLLPYRVDECKRGTWEQLQGSTLVKRTLHQVGCAGCGVRVGMSRAGGSQPADYLWLGQGHLAVRCRPGHRLRWLFSRFFLGMCLTTGLLIVRRSVGKSSDHACLHLQIYSPGTLLEASMLVGGCCGRQSWQHIRTSGPSVRMQTERMQQ